MADEFLRLAPREQREVINPESQYVVNWPEKYVGEFDILYC